MGVMKSMNTGRMLGDPGISSLVGMRMKAVFFDRRAVMDAVGRANQKLLSRAGAFIQRRAKSLIRKRKRASNPGEPPSSHVGTLRNLIYFGYDTANESVVIGPLPLGAIGIVPPTLEYGGESHARRNPRRKFRTIGDGGEIRIGGRQSITTKRNKDGKFVTYAKLNTQAQADRANQLNAELYGPETMGGGHIGPRPYMGPAFIAEQPNLPVLWANSVK
jgi:hypothetical protein